ncbi:NAD(+)/NADH kinase [Hydrogenobacter hydrogenophilus]|uniref:NAD kinase n=1 Tax=Hydrogenobacter hydrogenophilus TaxID=35835 RepID=A0A285NPR5_9AQUI|nr:NAD(+)/NADH kinase [Hydrogenobacter hydrogenophilus]SNZ11520.1 NAD+ kinase [Hydrogenobacter hydrogenophilus]
MKKVLLFVKDSQSAIETAKKIQKHLIDRKVSTDIYINRRGVKPKIDIKGRDLLLVVGGDGTFLAGARTVAKYQIPILGINEGRFGFLTEVEKEYAFEVLDMVLKGQIKYQKRVMISAYLKRYKTLRFLGDYLNDVVVSKSNIARMLELDVYTMGEFMMRVYGDGVIVSTPTGSTAYALSAGGPILYPLSENLLFVPICPHTLSNRPVILPSNFEIRLVNLSPDGMAYLTMDGQEGMALKKYDQIIVKKSKHYCLMYPNPKRSFFEILKEKLKWG